MKIISRVKTYTVEVVDDVFNCKSLLMPLVDGGRFFYVVDQSLVKFYAKPLQQLIGNDVALYIEAREPHKSYLKLADYYQALIGAGFRRNDVLVTLGGGILQDISGFIASTLYRGIKWAFIPTTLLAQADSCIGSKTSINFGEAKNLIGTFYPPDLILIDTALTQSLPPADFTSGVGEIIKFHLLSDQARYDRLKNFLASAPLAQSPQLKAIIDSTLQIKKSYFDQDEFDTGIRHLLNYGHCFGHALETVSEFSVPHGIAVIVGMGFANRVSLHRKLMSEKLFIELEALLKPFYPSLDFSQVTADQIIVYMKKDKKRVGQDLTMILAKGIGDAVKLNDISEAEIRIAYSEFANAYPSFK